MSKHEIEDVKRILKSFIGDDIDKISFLRGGFNVADHVYCIGVFTFYTKVDDLDTVACYVVSYEDLGKQVYEIKTTSSSSDCFEENFWSNDLFTTIKIFANDLLASFGFNIIN